MTTLEIESQKQFNSVDQSKLDHLMSFKIPVLSDNHYRLIDSDSILYVKGAGDYTKVYTVENEFLCNLSLEMLEERLGEKFFFRTHRSFLANLTKCDSICLNTGEKYIQMGNADKTRIPISRNKAKILRRLMRL